MKFLIDECLHTSLVTVARGAGHQCPDQRSVDTPRGNFMRVLVGLTHPLHSAIAPA